MCSKEAKENVPVERAFKATQEHWGIVVNFLESYPVLVKSKFANPGGDNVEIQSLWRSLSNQLNSLGYGTKTVHQWQQAVGRWKSKVKAKATAINLERKRTGGGEPTAPPLTEVEERLMGILGWRMVMGDNNVEMGVSQPQDVQPSTSRDAEPKPVIDDIAPPPLAFIKITTGGEPSRPAAPPPRKRKVPQSSEKTRKFVSMHKMHQENVDILKSIDSRIGALVNAVVDLAAAVRERRPSTNDQ